MRAPLVETRNDALHSEMSAVKRVHTHMRAWWKRIGLEAPSVLACCSYAASSTAVTILNKLVFSAAKFHYPWFTLAFQNIISVLLILIAGFFRITNAGALNLELSRAIALPCVCFVAFIFTNAQALRYLSLPVLTVWKSLGPLAITVVEAVAFRVRFSRAVYLASALVAISAAVTAKFDIEYSPLGYTWAAANLAANVAYLVSLRVCLKNSRASSLDKTFHSNLLSLILIVPLSWASGETVSVLDALSRRSLGFKLCYVASGAVTTAVCASAFWTIQVTSGSTMSFIGGMNKIPIVIISLLVFDDNVSLMGWVGVALGIVAGIVFVRAKANALTANELRSPLTSPRNNSIPGLSKGTSSTHLTIKNLAGS